MGLKKKDNQALFRERVTRILPAGFQVNQGGGGINRVCFRINTLKIIPEEEREALRGEGIWFESPEWCDEAVLVDSSDRDHSFLRQESEAGRLYRQNLSSVAVSRVLDPRPGERVLDLCAAPGSKSGHMAAMMKNEGELVCLEKVRARYYKLRSVLNLTGARAVTLCRDGRSFWSDSLFDKILLDVPCSSEGRYLREEGKAKAGIFWSLRKIREMTRKQRGLLSHGLKFLKPGGTLVYSTCTFAPEENEGIIDRILRKRAGEICLEKVMMGGRPAADFLPNYPAVRSWGRREYSAEIGKCLRVLPREPHEGFFIAVLKKPNN